MSPRTNPSTMNRRRSSAKGTMATEARWLPRTSLESVEFTNSFAHDMSPSNAGWCAGSALHFVEHDDHELGTISLDSFPMVDNSYMMPVLSNMGDCFSMPMHYAAMHPGSMSQTLTGPYNAHLMGEEILRPASMDTDYHSYNHLPSASFRHGLPSPPADIISPPGPDFPMDVVFTGLPDSVLAGSVTFKKMSPSSVPREYQPRPIRSASERDLIDHTEMLTQESQYSHDDRADKVKARSDPRYDQGPDKNGYYHCPLAGDGSCIHKPTKQKCIFAKYLDSHLKPYLCKHGYGKDCEGLRFSSNACLFRHEREAHGLHNHGLNPYLCLFKGCERARKDNGFPRRWNQRDHMKRVHDWIDADDVDNDVTPCVRVTEPPKRRKACGSSNGVAMKRSSSSHSKATAINSGAGARHTVSMSRRHAQADKGHRPYGTMDHPMPAGTLPYDSRLQYQQYPQIMEYPGTPHQQMVY